MDRRNLLNRKDKGRLASAVSTMPTATLTFTPRYFLSREILLFFNFILFLLFRVEKFQGLVTRVPRVAEYVCCTARYKSFSKPESNTNLIPLGNFSFSGTCVLVRSKVVGRLRPRQAPGTTESLAWEVMTEQLTSPSTRYLVNNRHPDRTRTRCLSTSNGPGISSATALCETINFLTDARVMRTKSTTFPL